MEKMDYSQSGGGQENIEFMAGQQDGLTPSEGSYMIPLREATSSHSPLKRRGSKKRKQVLVGGGRKRKTKKPSRKRRRRQQSLKRLNQIGFGRRRRVKKGKRKCVKRRK